MRYVQLIDYRDFALGRTAGRVYVEMTLRADKNRVVRFGLRTFATDMGVTLSALRCALDTLRQVGLITAHPTTHPTAHPTAHPTTHFSTYRILTYNELQNANDTPNSTPNSTPNDTPNDTFINNNNNNNNNIITSHISARVIDKICKAICDVCKVDINQAQEAAKAWYKEMQVISKTWKSETDALQHAVRWAQKYVFTSKVQKAVEVEKMQERANKEAETRRQSEEAERKIKADRMKAEVYDRMLSILPAPRGEEPLRWAERVLDAYYATRTQDKEVLTNYIIDHYD